MDQVGVLAPEGPGCDPGVLQALVGQGVDADPAGGQGQGQGQGQKRPGSHEQGRHGQDRRQTPAKLAPGDLLHLADRCSCDSIREELRSVGPRNTRAGDAAWFKINDIENWREWWKDNKRNAKRWKDPKKQT